MSGRRAALLTAFALGAVLVVVVAVVPPWSVLPDPSGAPVPVDPGAGLSGEQRRRAEAFAATLRPASVLSLVLGLGVSAVLGLTGLGARLVTRVAAPFGGSRAVQLVLGVGSLVVVGRLATLPVSAYAEAVRHRYGLSTRGWGLWLRDL
ncbi:MAG: M48 family peptidase, partial [Actinomycetes bacterium]